MSYTKTTWQDHIKDGSGNVIQQGTPVNAVNLNNIENGIVNATGIKDFATSTAYGINDVVISDGKIYRCKTAHTSSATLTLSYWTVIGGAGSMSDWAASKYYAVNDSVVYNGQVYRATVAHTSGTTFDVTKWQTIGGGIKDDTVATNTTYSSSKIESTFIKGSSKIWVQSTQPSDVDSKDGDIWIW